MDIDLSQGEELWITTPRGKVAIFWDDKDLMVNVLADPEVSVPNITELIGQEVNPENPQDIKQVCRVWLFDKEEFEKRAGEQKGEKSAEYFIDYTAERSDRSQESP